MSTLKDMLDKFVEDGVLTREEHDQFIEQVSADGKIDPEERIQMQRMFELIKTGKLKVVDEEREKFDLIKKKEALQKKLDSAKSNS
ncbi:MAG: hypothetical protein KBC84_03670 [Proteobacteria bacterium]|nr:hypothetical protein [Pseudomonadota bacterium]